jgi:hypothetical protein
MLKAVMTTHTKGSVCMFFFDRKDACKAEGAGVEVECIGVNCNAGDGGGDNAGDGGGDKD